MTRATFRTLLACAVLTVASSSDGGTITFNGTINNPHRFDRWAAPYSEAGFTLTPGAGQMFFIDSGNPYNVISYPGLALFDDDVLEFDWPNSGFTLTRDGGGLFDLSSVKTGSLGRSLVDDGNFLFTGFYAGGGLITATVVAMTVPQRHYFAGFTDLTNVVVSTTDGQFPVMDDLTVIPKTVAVPDAGSTLAMLLLGVGVVTASLRRWH